MNEMFQVIGSLASIGGVPLAIYLYIKSKEGKIDSVRREIVKLLSYQIGEGRNLKLFEIQTIINSKLREKKIKNNSIIPKTIIEDLVSETMSSPLLDLNRKEEILENLQKVYSNKSEKEVKNETVHINKGSGDNVAGNKVVSTNYSGDAQIIKRESEPKPTNLSSRFAMIVTILIFIFALIWYFSGLQGFIDNTNLQKDMFKNILSGVAMSVVAIAIINAMNFIKK